MSLEILPDELLLLICSYLSDFEVLQAFNDLNVRLNCTISKYRNHMDLTRVRYDQFNQYCDMLVRSTLGLQVQSLKLSNTKPVLSQVTLFAKRVWPLDQKLPNLECLTLIDVTDDELDLFVPKIVLLKKFTELTVESIETLFQRRLNTAFVRKPTQKFSSRERLSLQGIMLSSMLIFDWVEHTVTHLTVEIETTNDLIKLIYHFRCLQFLSVIIEKYEAVDPNKCPPVISSLQLKEFRMKTLYENDLLPFDEFVCLLTNMPNLQHFKFEIKLNIKREDTNKTAYLNGQKWHQVRTQLHHVVDFDCLMCLKFLPWESFYDYRFIRSQIVDSFSDFPDWFVTDHELTPYIYVHTKKLKIPFVNIEQRILGQLNGYQITALIDNVSELYIDADYYDDDTGHRPTKFPTLVLPDYIFLDLQCVSVAGVSFIFHNDLLESFLKQLFQRAPNLCSITISSTGDGNGPHDIDFVLSCFGKPSISVKDCTIDVKGGYDNLVMEPMVSRLPRLTSLTITRIYDSEDVINIVNICLTHLKHFIYLELEEPRYSLWNRYNQPLSDEKVVEPDRYLWLKENTILGSSMSERTFYADLYRTWKIWF